MERMKWIEKLFFYIRELASSLGSFVRSLCPLAAKEIALTPSNAL